ncbi:MAG: hypothetical protein R3Y64_11355 [Peptostreptococcaceae bacterium]
MNELEYLISKIESPRDAFDLFLEVNEDILNRHDKDEFFVFEEERFYKSVVERSKGLVKEDESYKYYFLFNYFYNMILCLELEESATSFIDELEMLFDEK